MLVNADAARLHGDFTWVAFCGAYQDQAEGAARVGFGHSSDHQRYLRRLRFAHATAAGIPFDERVTDGARHEGAETTTLLERLRSLAAPRRLLLVADSALVTKPHLPAADATGIRFVSRLPRGFDYEHDAPAVPASAWRALSYQLLLGRAPRRPVRPHHEHDPPAVLARSAPRPLQGPGPLRAPPPLPSGPAGGAAGVLEVQPPRRRPRAGLLDRPAGLRARRARCASGHRPARTIAALPPENRAARPTPANIFAAFTGLGYQRARTANGLEYVPDALTHRYGIRGKRTRSPRATHASVRGGQDPSPARAGGAHHRRQAARAHADLLELPIDLWPYGLAPTTWELRNLSAYDASYVALAEMTSTPLATLDVASAERPASGWLVAGPPAWLGRRPPGGTG